MQGKPWVRTQTSSCNRLVNLYQINILAKESSTRDLNTLSESYSNLDSLLSSSRSLVSTLIHSQKSDTWYLESAFFVLCFSIAWLVFRRLLYGPGWWLLYLPLNLFWRSSIAAFKLALGFLPSVALSAGSQKQSKALSIQLNRTQSTALRSTTLHQDYKTEMPEPSGEADAIAGGAGRSDAVRKSDAMPEMVEKVLKDTATLSETAAKDGGTDTQLRPRQEGEAPNPKKRMWEVRWRLDSASSLLKAVYALTRCGQTLANARTIHRSQLEM